MSQKVYTADEILDEVAEVLKEGTYEDALLEDAKVQENGTVQFYWNINGFKTKHWYSNKQIRHQHVSAFGEQLGIPEKERTIRRILGHKFKVMVTKTNGFDNVVPVYKSSIEIED